ncbi:hypothetical protein Salat_2115300 [Sesamum alatum]|uniref:Uncharacterized protein n=1 Tax=Sesamum alatum TaxID=300844 RepID=A0AAE1Y1Q6_9LAMI|nr:hypothetical protein Salat_2115300 [Sesamum alatum]
MVELDWCQFHVHVYVHPLQKMTTVIATQIGNRLGRFIVRDRGSNISLGSTMRIRVELDVRKLLLRCLKIGLPTGEHLMVSLSYERLSLFCYTLEFLVIEHDSVIDITMRVNRR